MTDSSVRNRPAPGSAPAAEVPSIGVRRGRVLLGSVLAGVLIAVAWSYELVDTTIGATMADAVLGHDSRTGIVGAAAGVLFAFAAGLGGTFTACNIAAFSALAPMMRGETTTRRWRAALSPMWWISVGMVPVSAAYGALGALLGERLPQLSTARVGAGGMPERLLQATAVYSVLGVVLVYLGLAALRLVPDPFAWWSTRRPQLPLVAMGVLIALFLVGRPYPLFFAMFQFAAERHDPLYGALTFVLVSIGNIAILATLSLVLALAGRGAFPRWLAARPGRSVAFTSAALLVAGVFTLVYWGIRLPAMFGYGWFPTMPWNG